MIRRLIGTPRRCGCLLLALGGIACLLLVADAFLLEPTWLAVRTVRLSDHPTVRVAHISDIHYRGDRPYLERALDRIAARTPDFVCFTGDLTDDFDRLDEVLGLLTSLSCPLFGVRGNHDCWGDEEEQKVAAAFRRTGGGWLRDRAQLALDGQVEVIGLTGYEQELAAVASSPGTPGECKRLVLVHYPLVADRLRGGPVDLILAGHSHGGQVRVPFFGAPILPYDVGRYDRGFFRTPAGPLYVNVGLGTFPFASRLFCRPEITLIEF